MTDTSPTAIERELHTVAEALTTPLPRECLLCFVWRMLEDFGCNATLRWARHWRDARAPRATALEHRLGQRGGFCDCEIFLNGWVLLSTVQRYDDDGVRDLGRPWRGVSWRPARVRPAMCLVGTSSPRVTASDGPVIAGRRRSLGPEPGRLVWLDSRQKERFRFESCSPGSLRWKECHTRHPHVSISASPRSSPEHWPLPRRRSRPPGSVSRARYWEPSSSASSRPSRPLCTRTRSSEVSM